MAFLWIPPNCRRVRAVVVGQNNMIEEGILEHPDFRQTLAELGVAEIFIAPMLDYFQNAATNDVATERFNDMLKTLARKSGYDELEFAPVAPLGHSAMASYPWNFAAWNQARTLAILSVHGDAPLTRLTGNGRPNLDWGSRGIEGVPGLMVMGEYEWWEDRLTPAMEFRAKHPDTPVAMLADVGHGHFDYSDELVRFLAMFLRKACEQRLPADAPSDRPPALVPVDPRKGWLVDRWRKEEGPRAVAAPFGSYTGDVREAFWCFDGEMARATEKFNPQRGKAPQLVGFVQDGKIVDQTPNTHEQIRLKLPRLDDSLTFTLTGAFLDTVPAGTNPAKWTGLTNGVAIGHASGGGPVVLSRISGPVVQLAADKFAVRFNRASIPADRRMGDIWLLASHPGDAKYKSAVQQAVLRLPPRNLEGAAQQITFPPIPDQKLGLKTLKLNATSDANVPVYFYVREGPAEVDGDTLTLTKIPPRAKFPLTITIVAWQWGRTVEPKLQSATPVVRQFIIKQ
ncbi:MAG TPA: hypothetical protein VMV72_10805 [Verrucomicrobiae bacterium]|nr:hypothetical protein [Verrucomicrobiae bacterium]